MIRVLFILRDLVYHGGVPKCILNFVRSCPRQQVEVHVASMMPPQPKMVEAFAELGIEPVCVGDGGYVEPITALRRVIREHDIDVVVTTAFKPYVCGKLASTGLDRGIIFWIHAIPGVITGPVRKVIFSVLARHDPLVFVSKAVRDVHVYAGHNGTQATIFNGVEDPCTHPEHAPYERSRRAEFGLPPDALVLAYTAEFTAWKDHATLLAAFGQFRQHMPEARLVLMGTGALEQAMRQRARELGIDRHVHFLGARTDARRVLGLIDIYVHSSCGEGLGLAVVEAMLVGKPVVVTRSSAFLEYIEHGITGMMFDAGNARALADQLLLLAANPGLAERIGREARVQAMEKFDPDLYVSRLCEQIEHSVPRVRKRGRRSTASSLAGVAPVE